MPYPTFTIDAAFLRTPKALMRGSGKRSDGPPMSKFWRELAKADVHRQGKQAQNAYPRQALRRTAASAHPSSGLRGPGALRRCRALCGTSAPAPSVSTLARRGQRPGGEQHTMASAVDENRRVCEARAFSLNCGTRDQSQSEDRGSHGSGGSAARWQNHMSRGCGMASEDRLTKAVARERRSAAILSRN